MKKSDHLAGLVPLHSSCLASESQFYFLSHGRIEQMSQTVKRLFNDFAPSHYDLDLVPDRVKMTFSGTVVISGRKTGRPSKRLTFHQKDLKVSAAQLIKHDKHGDKEIAVTRLNKQASLDEIRVHSDELLYPGTYTLTLSFSGKITDQMHGLYPAYFTYQKIKKSILVTQFESHHAREVFPCIDEPEAKAVFSLRLTTDSGDVVLSNTLPKKETTKGKLRITQFEPTPIMSTYLLAFAIGDLHCYEAKTKSDTLIRSWATPNQPKSFLRYATEEAIAVLDFFTDYFGLAYPLPKCDQLALPDFESGAMENWGLITYREIALLVDPVNRSLSTEQYTSMVIAHELSHQWFGNLVTMRWWDDLWLNESFAGIMEHLALDSLHPDWSQWEQYMLSDVLLCSSRDVYKDVQPLRANVTSPDLISSLFDPAIVYTKGGRLIRMLWDYIGQVDFRRGIQAYFKEHAYKNTTRDDLWASLGEASGKDIKALMDPWVNQSGMPLVSVATEGETTRLQQNRLLLDGKDTTSQWPIPLLANQPVSTDILTSKQSSVTTKKGAEPLLLNVTGSGHFVVHYEDKVARDYLAQSIKTQSLRAESRINVLNDLVLTAKSGNGSLVEALEIVRVCEKEPREAVWGMLGRVVGLAASLTEGDDLTDKAIKQLRRDLARYWYEKLGWDDKRTDSPNDILLRHTAIGLMLSGEDPHAIKEALRRFNAAKSIDELPAEQRGLILVAVVRHQPKSINELLSAYPKTANQEVQLAIAAGLTEARKPADIEKIIKQAIGEHGFVRPQDIFRWFAYLMRNRYSREQAWQWLETNWSKLEVLFGGGMHLDDFTVYAAGPLSTKDGLKRYKAFFVPKLKDITLRRNIQIGLSEIAARIDWREREEPKIKKFFTT